MEWYIVRAQANRERKVSERIIKEGEKGELTGVIGRVVVPTEKVFLTKDGKKTQREKVLFPGYVFVETSAIGEYCLIELEIYKWFLKLKSTE